MPYRTKNENLLKAIYYMLACSDDTDDFDAIDHLNDLMMDEWCKNVGELNMAERESDIELFELAGNWTIKRLLERGIKK